MKKIFKVLIVLGLIFSYTFSISNDIDKEVLKYINITLISVYMFFEGNEYRSFHNNYLNEILRLLIIYLFWNITYLVIDKGIFIDNNVLFDIFINTILLKSVIFEFLAVLFICSIFKILLKNKKIIPIILIILLVLFIILKSEYIIYVFTFVLGLHLKRINLKNINNPMINIINDSSISTIIINKFLIFAFSNVNLINNTSDLLGVIFLSYLLGTILKIYLSYFPIIRKLI